ncbi:MAG TPA: hypothetical protein VE974_30345 [Thermoanaerobaculia bacterium]|nr:hypothetical protein [Thermoanaerobaculia bacterium]
MAEAFFRELRGDYVENAGQVVTPREYLDYLEPLGSALSRRPDGAGGPFVFQFRGSGGRVVGAMGWVVSAASKRYGGWNLWGVWTDGAIPALALPLCWPDLPDAQKLPALVRRANDDAESLQRRDAWPELLDRMTAMRLHEDEFRAALKAELARLYRSPYPDVRPIEIELEPAMLDLLPWLYLLGPVEPGTAQLLPSRFNGAGYQYIFTDAVPADIDVPGEIDNMVDTTVNDVLQGFRMAAALRERRARPRVSKTKPRSPESIEMRNTTSPLRRPKPPAASALPDDLIPTVLRAVRDVIIIALLSWIGFNVHQLRKSMTAASVPATVATVTSEPEPVVPAPTREERIASALVAQPPQGIRIEASATRDLPRAAVEIFLRRNNCFARTEPVDGRFSTAEQRAIRNCSALTTQRLMRNTTDPHPERTLDWLERTLGVTR